MTALVLEVESAVTSLVSRATGGQSYENAPDFHFLVLSPRDSSDIIDRMVVLKCEVGLGPEMVRCQGDDYTDSGHSYHLPEKLPRYSRMTFLSSWKNTLTSPRSILRAEVIECKLSKSLSRTVPASGADSRVSSSLCDLNSLICPGIVDGSAVDPRFSAKTCKSVQSPYRQQILSSASWKKSMTRSD